MEGGAARMNTEHLQLLVSPFCVLSSPFYFFRAVVFLRAAPPELLGRGGGGSAAFWPVGPTRRPRFGRPGRTDPGPGHHRSSRLSPTKLRTLFSELEPVSVTAPAPRALHRRSSPPPSRPPVVAVRGRRRGEPRPGARRLRGCWRPRRGRAAPVPAPRGTGAAGSRARRCGAPTPGRRPRRRRRPGRARCRRTSPLPGPSGARWVWSNRTRGGRAAVCVHACTVVWRVQGLRRARRRKRRWCGSRGPRPPAPTTCTSPAARLPASRWASVVCSAVD